MNEIRRASVNSDWSERAYSCELVPRDSTTTIHDVLGRARFARSVGTSASEAIVAIYTL